MTVPIAFTKASGAGNDFVVVNNFSGDLRVDYAALARAVCDRHFGVGGDGLLVVEKSSKADFAMQYYNADGSWGGMCGNGGRCIARFAQVTGIAGPRQRFEALGHIYDAEIGPTTVTLRMKDPGPLRNGLKLSVEGTTHEASFLDTGAPHVVIFARDTAQTDVSGIGRAIRNHAEFQPAGTNVNFVRRTGASTIELRTYERGVEAETLACGTGSVASALVAAATFGISSPIQVRVRSGEDLTVHFSGAPGSWSDVRLEGSAHMLFSGTLVFRSDPPTIMQTA